MSNHLPRDKLQLVLLRRIRGVLGERLVEALGRPSKQIRVLAVKHAHG